ncbi:MAG: TetM/TetW/TetO/TetS family tetracycline resistance ribosomal protection protein [Oscillospiraceae bacterium]|nr:TetM/TetW/TetO/TetS family tetracycline resistance ribosomal protection protein [Oscillospiraceae bacterium]
MRKSVIGILAHVDAGKTTLAEAMLYKTGKIRKLGRVDKGDTLLDTHALERERGITIFAGQAVLELDGLEVTLLDTPGHVDFSAEAERVLQVLDYAVLVISSTDCVQSHTLTLWNLLQIYHIPTFIFVTKMDFARASREEILSQLRRDLSPDCIDFSEDCVDARSEAAAMCREDVLEKYLDTGEVSDEDLGELVGARMIFPCFFGSGLKLEGIDLFLDALRRYTVPREYPNTFGAKVFKITHDPSGTRLTHLKVTGGTLRVRDELTLDGQSEKVSAIRIYSGEKFVTADAVEAGGVCAVAGLQNTRGGQGLGMEQASGDPVIEPVMNYRIVLPPTTDAKDFLPKLRLLEEEDPQLHITWNSHLQEIHVGLMGEIQTEILRSCIAQRFGVDVTIDSGRVLYKETIENTVEGVGHYEPLRHYAEVHLILEPLERGKGLHFATRCSEDVLDRNWQRLILTHLAEKQHLGVLTGSPITDMKITLAAGRAHLKHTEGGDFRQSTYRAVRQGLMQAKSVLLEPYYSFRLEVPQEQIGRAISDIRARNGEFSAPEDAGGVMILRGTAPVTALNGYASEVAAYTGGRGRLMLTVCGYDVCHDADAVIEAMAYDAESDLDNSPDSVFCAHGSGFPVKWDKVPEYMHIESCLKKKEDPYRPVLNRRNFHIDDKELEQIMTREFGPARQTSNIYRPVRAKAETQQTDVALDKRRKYLIVDGYNVIFAWQDLKALADTNLDAARETLMHVLSNYAAYTESEVVLVFDAYMVAGNAGSRFDYHNIHVAYTKERETGDAYIEKLVADIGKNYNVRVVTSDNLIRLSAVRVGVLRLSAQEFEKEIDRVHEQIADFIRTLRTQKKSTVADAMERKRG